MCLHHGGDGCGGSHSHNNGPKCMCVYRRRRASFHRRCVGDVNGSRLFYHLQLPSWVLHLLSCTNIAVFDCSTNL